MKHLKRLVRQKVFNLISWTFKRIQHTIPEVEKVKILSNDVNWSLDMKSIQLIKQIFDSIGDVYSPKTKLVRLGDNSDGGYVCAADITKKDTVLSIGVGDNTSFDLSVISLGARVVMVDHTVNNPNIDSPNAIFIPRKMSALSGRGKISLDELLLDYPADDYILKMDIEGDEWEILDNITLQTLTKFRQLIIEFHDITYPYYEERINRTLRALEKLAITHRPILIHANNGGRLRLISGTLVPDVVEVTFLRRDSYVFTKGYNKNVKQILKPNIDNVFDVSDSWIEEIRKPRFFLTS